MSRKYYLHSLENTVWKDTIRCVPRLSLLAEWVTDVSWCGVASNRLHYCHGQLSYQQEWSTAGVTGSVAPTVVFAYFQIEVFKNSDQIM